MSGAGDGAAPRAFREGAAGRRRALVDLHCHTSASFDSLSDPVALARAAAARGVAAVRERSAALDGDDVWLAASHGDLIKAIVADALGTPLDLFQRISIDPASITVIRHGGERPTVVRVNDSGTPLAALLSARQKGSLLDRIRGRNGGAR